MASIYKDLKPLEKRMNSGLISQSDAREEFCRIWINSSRGGKNRRCAKKFIRDNFSNSGLVASLELFVELNV